MSYWSEKLVELAHLPIGKSMGESRRNSLHSYESCVTKVIADVLVDETYYSDDRCVRWEIKLITPLGVMSFDFDVHQNEEYPFMVSVVKDTRANRSRILGGRSIIYSSKRAIGEICVVNTGRTIKCVLFK
jgi:hypothetical protein